MPKAKPAPPAPPAGEALLRAIAALARSPAARLAVGQPGHIALLDADPRRDDARARVRRLWVSGQPREIVGAVR